MKISQYFLMGGSLGALLMCLPQTSFAQEPVPKTAEIWALVQKQQAKIDQLETELAEAKIERIETSKSVEIVADAIEGTGGDDHDGHGWTDGWWKKTSVGGYGELHYEGGAKDELDFHRFVLFLGHEFTDKIRFFSEVELEHAIAADGAPGAVELEQAFIEFDVSDDTQVYGGLQLVPVGTVNETHEPPTFFGVERNAIERNIIPTTWWEAGVGTRGNIGKSGISYDLMVSSGLFLNTANDYVVRAGRQRVAEARFKSAAYTGRVQYSGIPGFRIGSSIYYQPDVTQGVGDSISGTDVSGLLWTSNIDAKFQGFGLKALHANWALDGDEVDISGRNKQNGYYIEPSYSFDISNAALDGLFEQAKLGIFYRYASWDNLSGLDNNTGTSRNIIGANFWPIPDVVLKMDYIFEKKESGGETAKSINLGIGYQF